MADEVNMKLRPIATNKLIICYWIYLYHFRAAYIYSLNTVADFADLIGQDGSAFKSKAGEILEATKPHYGAKGDFIYETDVRPQDGAVIHSIATFGN